MSIFDNLSSARKFIKELVPGVLPDSPKEKEEKARQEEERAKKERENKVQKLLEFLMEHEDDYLTSTSLVTEFYSKQNQFERIANEEEKANYKKWRNEHQENKRAQERNATLNFYNKLLTQAAEETQCEYGKGGCGWHGRAFYCTCGDDECPKKKYIHSQNGFQCELLDPAHLPYVKLLSQFSPSSYDYKLYDKDNDHLSLTKEELLRYFFDVFMPDSHSVLDEDDLDEDDLEEDADTGYVDLVPKGGMYTRAIVQYFCDRKGLGANNTVMRILFDYYKKTGNRNPHIGELIYLEQQRNVNLNQDFFFDPSLYDRSSNDFMYAALVLDAINDPDDDESFSQREKVDVAQLYNADGTIRETGFGGPRSGHYGEVIFNIVSEWGCNIPLRPMEVMGFYAGKEAEVLHAQNEARDAWRAAEEERKAKSLAEYKEREARAKEEQEARAKAEQEAAEKRKAEDDRMAGVQRCWQCANYGKCSNDLIRRGVGLTCAAFRPK